VSALGSSPKNGARAYLLEPHPQIGPSTLRLHDSSASRPVRHATPKAMPASVRRVTIKKPKSARRACLPRFRRGQRRRGLMPSGPVDPRAALRIGDDFIDGLNRIVLERELISHRCVIAATTTAASGWGTLDSVIDPPHSLGPANGEVDRARDACAFVVAGTISFQI
jgi:hypothetical protein